MIKEIRYRAVQLEDFAECVDLFFESLSDMRTRHNTGSSSLPPRSYMLAGYEHVRSTGIFHVAEVDRRIIALACAILRDHLWFCAGFWVRPDLQHKGVGMPLLRSVWERGRSAGAKIFFVWSSIDLPAMASYMKLGMLPGCQMLTFEGTPKYPAVDVSRCTVHTLDKEFAMDMDHTILGTRRGVDHDFWFDTGLQGRQVFHNAESIGYYYHSQGSIGPIAWKEPHHAELVLALACREVGETNQKVNLEIPGMNHHALRFAFVSGLRLTAQSHLFTSAPIGLLEQYIPSGPGFF